jgi:Putative Ig domain
LLVTMGQPATAARGKWRNNPPGNTAPSISGTPSTSVEATKTYSFSPTAVDAQNNTLSFSVSNKPVWATFSATTGRLSGTPASTQVGSYANIVIKVSDGWLRTALPAFTIAVSAGTTTVANSAPLISGTPATSVMAGSNYSFQPQASDPDGNMLGFSVSNKPSWALFSTSTGAMTGAPTALQAGTTSNIVISVSDGLLSKSLSPFSVAVTQPVTPPVAAGTATLVWTPPTQNTDGTTLTDLAGYRVYHGTSASNLNEVIDSPGAGVTSYRFDQLTSGTHYFAITAYNLAGMQSAQSAIGSKAIQ